MIILAFFHHFCLILIKLFKINVLSDNINFPIALYFYILFIFIFLYFYCYFNTMSKSIAYKIISIIIDIYIWGICCLFYDFHIIYHYLTIFFPCSTSKIKIHSINLIINNLETLKLYKIFIFYILLLNRINFV